MRLLLLASLAAMSQLPSTSADACGYDFYRPPGMFLVAAHHGRTFVLLDNAVANPDSLDWKRDRNSYDWTAIAETATLPEARTLTIVGEQSIEHTASRDHVFIKPVFETQQPMNALEIYPSDHPRIAIDGDHQVRWTGLATIPVSLDTIAWAEHPGFSPALDGRFLTATKLDGTELEMITAHTGGQPTTYFRTGDRTPWGGYAGSPIGAVTVDNVRYIVLVNDGLITPVRA